MLCVKDIKNDCNFMVNILILLPCARAAVGAEGSTAFATHAPAHYARAVVHNVGRSRRCRHLMLGVRRRQGNRRRSYQGATAATAAAGAINTTTAAGTAASSYRSASGSTRHGHGVVCRQGVAQAVLRG